MKKGNWIKIGPVLLCIGFVGFCLHLAYNLYIGHGTHQYSNFYGLKFSYIGVVVVLALVPIVVLLGLVIEWVLGRHERAFLKKYKDRIHK